MLKYESTEMRWRGGGKNCCNRSAGAEIARKVAANCEQATQKTHVPLPAAAQHMFKALGSSLGTFASRPNPKDGGTSPKPRRDSTPKDGTTTIGRLVALVREGRPQAALEELARVPPDAMQTMCLLAEPNNKSTLLHAAAEVGSEEVAKAVIAYTGPPGMLSPLINAPDKQGTSD